MRLDDKIVCINDTLYKKRLDYFGPDFIFSVGYSSGTASNPTIFVSEANGWFYESDFKVVTNSDIRRMKLKRLCSL